MYMVVLHFLDVRNHCKVLLSCNPQERRSVGWIDQFREDQFNDKYVLNYEGKNSKRGIYCRHELEQSTFPYAVGMNVKI